MQRNQGLLMQLS